MTILGHKKVRQTISIGLFFLFASKKTSDFPGIFLIAQFFNILAGNIFIVFHLLVDNTMRGQFDNTVTNGLHKLVIV